MKNITRTHFLRHVATLISGRIASLVLSIVLVPVIARLFEPADFGVMAMFLALANGLALVLPLRYYRASLFTRDDMCAQMLLAMSVKLLVAGCVVVLAVVAVAGPSGLNVGFLSPLGVWVWLIPIGVLLDGLGQIMTTVHSRHSTYRNVAVADIGQTLLMGGSRILAGLGGSSVWGLIFGQFVGGAGRVLLLSKHGMNPISLLSTRVPWHKARELAAEYRDFPLHNMPAALVTFLSGRIPIFVLSMMFAPAAVGFYAMADRLIRLPVDSTGLAIREVFMRKLAGNALAGAGLRRPLSLLTLGMLLLGIVPFGVLGFFGAEILTIILGERWADAGIYVQILAPWYYAAWVSTGVQPTLVALRRQAMWLRIQFSTVLGRLAVFGIGYLTAADVKTTLTWFSWLNALSAVSLIALVFYLLSSHQGTTAPPGYESDFTE